MISPMIKGGPFFGQTLPVAMVRHNNSNVFK